MKSCEVIIVGAGPTGLSLAVELGLLGINTIIIEKASSLGSIHPKAQQLNPRTLQFFRRWGISQRLIAKKLLPDNYPIRYIWYDKLDGKMYSATDDMAQTITKDLSPENYLRIPLWLTQETLCEKLQELPSVELLLSCKITNFAQTDSEVTATAIWDGKKIQLQARYLIACDGGDSYVRHSGNFTTEVYRPAQKMLQIVFSSPTLKSKITLPEATVYYNLALKNFSLLIVFDGQYRWSGDFACPDNATLADFDLSALLEQLAGFAFEKTIDYAAFWYMEPLIATTFQQQRILLAGDAAHVLTPVGGHGLNTGMADSINLAWKLAAVIKDQASPELLKSYEIERRTVALEKLLYVRANTKKLLTIYQDFPPDTMPDQFSEENQKIAERLSCNLKIVLGDAYTASPIIVPNPNLTDEYEPWVAKPGYFAPHCWLTENICLYDILSLKHILLVSKKANEVDIKKLEAVFKGRNIPFQRVNLYDYAAEKFSSIYSSTFYLLRPDWHIAWCDDKFPQDLNAFLQRILPR
jgi:2-polyprenyl-6-methoxyphenol hydroxylase-like FAD-dependent oxidoreductase